MGPTRIPIQGFKIQGARIPGTTEYGDHVEVRGGSGVLLANERFYTGPDRTENVFQKKAGESTRARVWTIGPIPGD